MKSNPITYQVQCFGIAREICGSDFIEAILPAQSKVSDLQALLKENYPKLQELRHFFIARNQAYATPDELLKTGDELVIIPPVSGG